MELGKDINAEEVIDQLLFFDGWEEKYSYIIDLGKDLAPLDEQACCDENIIKGCQSQVWLISRQEGDTFVFDADSDALIVKGLLALTLIAYNHKTAAEIQAFDFEQYFEKLDLISHISNIRGNGLKAMVSRIREIAAVND